MEYLKKGFSTKMRHLDHHISAQIVGDLVASLSKRSSQPVNPDSPFMTLSDELASMFFTQSFRVDRGVTLCNISIKEGIDVDSLRSQIFGVDLDTDEKKD
jgi:hypothetical protein